MRFVIIGAGAIGGPVGACLSASGHEVVLVARGAHYDAINAKGLQFATPGGLEVARVDVVEHPSSVGFRDGDVVLLAVKSQDTQAALDTLATSAPVDVPLICLQNGVENERVALRHFSNVYGALVIAPGTYLSPGAVSIAAAPVFGIIDVGRYPTGLDEVASEFATALNASRFSSVASPAIMRWKYAKLLDNLSNANQVVLGLDGGGSQLGALARAEGLACFSAAGIEVATTDETDERRRVLVRERPIGGEARSGSSTWQSLARGTGSLETDYLNGEIVLLGRLYGIPTPVNLLLQELSADVIAGRLEPGSVSEDELLERVASPDS